MRLPLAALAILASVQAWPAPLSDMAGDYEVIESTRYYRRTYAHLIKARDGDRDRYRLYLAGGSSGPCDLPPDPEFEFTTEAGASAAERVRSRSGFRYRATLKSSSRDELRFVAWELHTLGIIIPYYVRSAYTLRRVPGAGCGF